MSHPQPSTGHAIVIGGSIAGMLTARVLTDHFARVTVIERDNLPDAPAFRAGAPHARHPHGLLVRGQQVMEEFFPGLTADLHAQGALAMNMGRDLHLYIGAARAMPFDADLQMTVCSRPLLEYTILRRLRALPQVDFVLGHDVTGLRTDATGGRVTGVNLRARGAQGAERSLHADLVVDASGRTSKTPEWLAALGFTPPEETVVDAKAGYATRIYRRPASMPANQAIYCIPQAPHQARGGILVSMEGDRMQVTLTGFNGDYPPTDEAEFLAFARSLPTGDIHAAIAAAEPLTEPYGYRRIANRLRHYDELPRYLEGLLVIGDAVYAFNPVYGQGMTVAALGAQLLGRALARRPQADDVTGLAQGFQRELGKLIAMPWQMATGQDLRWPVAGAAQRTSPMTRLMQRYFDRTLIAMTLDPEVAAAFSRVQNMLTSPLTLFHPRIVWRALRAREAHVLEGYPAPGRAEVLNV